MERRCFTLLELLIVIIVIGVLAAVGMVQYGQAVSGSKNSQARSVLSNMRRAAMAFQSINNAWPANCANINVDFDSDGVDDVVFAVPASNDFAFSCPGGIGRANRIGSPGASVWNWAINFSTGLLTSSN